MSIRVISAPCSRLHSSLISDTLLVVHDDLLSDFHLGFMVNAVIELLAAGFLWAKYSSLSCKTVAHTWKLRSDTPGINSGGRDVTTKRLTWFFLLRVIHQKMTSNYSWALISLAAASSPSQALTPKPHESPEQTLGAHWLVGSPKATNWWEEPPVSLPLENPRNLRGGKWGGDFKWSINYSTRTCSFPQPQVPSLWTKSVSHVHLQRAEKLAMSLDYRKRSWVGSYLLL